MKNITITLDEKTAAWARSHANELNMSLSRYLGELLEKTMRQAREYDRAMRQYLARPPAVLKKPGAQYPTRDELHERRGIR